MADPLAYLGEQIESWKSAGTYQRLRVLESESAAESRFDGKEVINLASNNYLGLTTHPKLREAAIEADAEISASDRAPSAPSPAPCRCTWNSRNASRASRTWKPAWFFSRASPPMPAPFGDSDAGRPHHLRRAEPRQHHRRLPPFEGEDPRLPAQGRRRGGEILAGLAGAPGRKLLITDGVFSMDGDIGPLPGLVEAAEKHGAIMMVDDAHSSGVLGRNGRGTIDHFDLHGRVHIQVGTLSKAIGVLGGYVCGSRDLIEFLYHRARPFLFSTSHPPAVAASCLAAFDVLEQEPERIENLWNNTRYFKQGLTEAGFDTGISETPITPVMVGEANAPTSFREPCSRKVFWPPASDSRPCRRERRACAPS